MIQTLNSPVELGRHLAKSARPQNAIYPLALAIAGYVLTGGRSWPVVLALFLTIYSLEASAATINNLFDSAIDRLNKRGDNPLALNHISATGIKAFVLANGVALGLLQLLLDQPLSLILVLIILALLLAYSLPPVALEKRGLIATLVLSLCYGTLPLLLGLSQSGIPPIGWWLGGLQILLLSPALLAKDYKDRKGDKAFGKLTPLVRFGEKKVRQIAFVLLVAGVLLTVGLPIGIWAKLAVIVLAAIYALGVYRLHKTWQEKHTQQPLLLKGILLAIACIVLAAS